MARTKRPLIFLGVGLVNTLLDFGFYTFLTSVIWSDGTHIALAGFISGTFALICAFILHGFITWRGSHIGHKTIITFIAFTGFGMWVIRPLLLSAFIKLHGLYDVLYHFSQAIHLPFSFHFIANTGAFGLMLVIVLSYNYIVYNRFVFKKKASSDHIEPENHSAS